MLGIGEGGREGNRVALRRAQAVVVRRSQLRRGRADQLGRRGPAQLGVVALQEYDLEIKPAKIVRGQGFCRLLAGASNIRELGDTDQTKEINQISITDSESQYADLIFYLKNGYAPPNLSYRNKRAIRLKTKKFTIIDDVLFRQNYDSILLRCLEKPEAQKVLQELHDGPAGGHFGADTTAHKIIHAGYYWPTLFRDAHEYVRKC